jgi:hypothetical protein
MEMSLVAQNTIVRRQAGVPCRRLLMERDRGAEITAAPL